MDDMDWKGLRIEMDELLVELVDLVDLVGYGRRWLLGCRLLGRWDGWDRWVGDRVEWG